jgi:hypothetical protein
MDRPAYSTQVQQWQHQQQVHAAHLIILPGLDPVHSLTDNRIVTKAQVIPEPQQDAACTITAG